MTNGLTDEQRLVQETAQQFSQDVVRPLARKIDHEHYFPAELIPELAKVGFLGVFVPEELGGAGLDYLSYSLIVEELAKACASTSVIVSAHNSLCIWPILAFGSAEQKQHYLPRLAKGETLGCFALSEPNTGSDAARLTCSAREEGGGWRISGTKNWITNAPVSGVCVLFAMERPEDRHRGIRAFIVELEADAGIAIGPKEDKLGICGSPTASITFTDTVLPASRLLGKKEDGFKVAMKTLDGGRIGISAQATGIAAAALEDSLRYAKERQAFGKPIGEHQLVQGHLADMSCRISAARALTRLASSAKDAGLPYSREAAEAKLFASEAATFCSHRAVQIHGGYGYVKDFNVERYYRDAKITEIYEGTSEIQRLVIAGELLRES